MRILLINFLFFLFFSGYSQDVNEIINQAQSSGISSEEDILKELERRGMTVQDAQRMALIYGIDYNEYISQYITGSEVSSSINLPVISELIVQNDSVQEILEDSLQEDIIESLNYFGYDIFLNNPFANKEYLVGNIDEGYILAPGDVLRIYVFGDNTYQSEVKIDLNGNILLPDIGMFFASGYTFSSLKSRLNDFLGRSFSGLIDNPKRSFLDVSLTQLRPVKITLLGESNTPGPHLVGGFATVLNALYSSGGIKTSGTLRNIQVFRNNKLRKKIDLYDYITKGSLDGDIRLMNNDIIFIPVRGNTVELNGSVRNASIYELKEGEGINDLLNYSGGLNANSSSLAVINRIRPLSERTNETYNRFLSSFDISRSFLKQKEIYVVNKGEYLYLIAKKFNTTVNEIKEWNNLTSNNLHIGQKLVIFNEDFKLIDGDQVSFSPIPEKILNTISINGSVNRPGSYPLDKFSDLKELITEAANNILPRTFLGKIDVSREKIDGSRSFISYNLSSVLKGDIKVELEDQDEVRVFSLDEVEGDDDVLLSGFSIDSVINISWRANLNLYDVVFSNTPYNENEFQADFLRSRVDVKRFNDNGLYSIIPLDIDDNRNFTLQPKDEIVLYSKDITENLSPTFQISGFVNNVGTYRLDSMMTVEDAILAAGGLSEFADINRVAINSLDLKSKTKSSVLKYVSLDMDYINGRSEKPNSLNTLKPFDRISLYKDPNIKDLKTLTVVGEVNAPGSVSFEDVIESMGSVLNKAGGVTEFASLESSYIIRNGELLDFNFTNLNTSKAFLNDGDSIMITGNFEEITVSGAVNNPSKVIYSKSLSAKKYVRLSGGKLSTTSGKPFVIYPSGKSKKVGFLRNPKVYPGSEVFVPFEEKTPFLDRFANSLNNGLDRIIQISALATTTITTIFLVKNINN
ncbi:SLBB domain-containing protein [Cytophagia bacterium]|nr:SLBB domain-containing protein [Cytophagia bacterium]